MGYTVVMPHLFGNPGAPATTTQIIKAIARVCVSNEFTKLKAGVTSPVADWLRSLARSLHGELGGPGVGAIGMCLTGGFALAMMVDESIAAPVVAQPSLPGPLGRSRAGDLGLSPADREAVRRRVAGGCPVLGVRYRSDPATGTRFDTLTNELGDGFIKVELEGKGHATLTATSRTRFTDATRAHDDTEDHDSEDAPTRPLTSEGCRSDAPWPRGLQTRRPARGQVGRELTCAPDPTRGTPGVLKHRNRGGRSQQPRAAERLAYLGFR